MSQDARRTEEISTQRRADILGLNYQDVSLLEDKQLYKQLLPIAELYRLKVIPISADKHHIKFGITNTTSQQTLKALASRFQDQRVEFCLISDSGYHDYMQLYDPPPPVVYQDITLEKTDTKELVQMVSATLEQVKADDMLAYLVEQAHNLGASDIHMEAAKDLVRIRYRIDGVLHSIAKLTKDKYRILVAAVASAGNVSTASSQAQQGHIALLTKMADGSVVDVNVRLETVPTINGLDIVMRLFNMDQSMYVLDRLGLSTKERAVVDDIIKKPSGLVLVVGPTGSGKTTTLYSMLNTLNSDERKIITLEDPVEYQFEGISQISISSTDTQQTNFADNLRAVLRLDPDIIMVGEIRDNDTARTALQASLTGHLVLSTFHASSAAAALTRLMDVIGTNPLFVSAIRLVMAQRLVRQLDPDTKQPLTLDEPTKKRLEQIINTLPAGVERPNIEQCQFYGPGKSEANPFGYRGQIALREQFLMNGEIRNLLEKANQQIISTDEIEAAAIASGMTTMLQEGVIRICAGQTTASEVFRVLG